MPYQRKLRGYTENTRGSYCVLASRWYKNVKEFVIRVNELFHAALKIHTEISNPRRRSNYWSFMAVLKGQTNVASFGVFWPAQKWLGIKHFCTRLFLRRPRFHRKRSRGGKKGESNKDPNSGLFLKVTIYSRFKTRPETNLLIQAGEEEEKKEGHSLHFTSLPSPSFVPTFEAAAEHGEWILSSGHVHSKDTHT